MPKAKRVPANSVDGRGQPTIRTDENALTVCSVIGNGGTIAEAAKAIGCQPVSIRVWEHTDPNFKTLVTRAKEFWADAAADEGWKIAGESPKMIVAEDGTERVDSGWVQHITSRLNYMKWLMSKRDPKRYGDRLEVDQKVTGEIEHRVTITEERRRELMDKHRLALGNGN